MQDEGVELLPRSPDSKPNYSTSISLIQLSKDELPDDLISTSVRDSTRVFQVTLRGWLIAFYIAVIQRFNQRPWVNHPVAFVFIPMIGATVAGALLMLKKVRAIYRSGLVLISEERKLFLLAEGKQQQIKECFILYESMPLMRKFLYTSFIFIFAFADVAVSQLLFFTYYAHRAISIWTAVSPLIFLYVLGLFYVIVMTKTKLINLFFMVVVATTTLLGLLKADSGTGIGWALVMVPVLFLQLSLVLHILYVLYGSVVGSFSLTKIQHVAAFLIAGAGILLFAGEMLYFLSLRLGDSTGPLNSSIAPTLSPTLQPAATTSMSPINSFAFVFSIRYIREEVCAFVGSIMSQRMLSAWSIPSIRNLSSPVVLLQCTVLGVVGVTLLVEGLLLVIYSELDALATTRGFTPPAALSLYGTGWDQATGRRYYRSPVLGRIRCPASTLQQLESMDSKSTTIHAFAAQGAV